MKVKYATIIVRDMDESIKFYTEVLGLEIDSHHNPRPGVTITLLKGEGDAMVELIKNNENEPGLYSVGMDVEDMNTTLEALRSKGAKVTSFPFSSCSMSIPRSSRKNSPFCEAQQNL